MQRISVVGTSGSGKTTLARDISQLLCIPHVELDYLHWEPNWVEVSDDIFLTKVSQALSGDTWVVDGNYGKVRDIVWSRADTIVFLNYSLPVIMNRLIRRTFSPVLTQEEVCNGNRESWQKTFSRDSVLLWALQTYNRNRTQYPLLFQKPEFAHINVVQMDTPQATQDWLLLSCPVNSP
jgi:adenylate kinase family enzyme